MENWQKVEAQKLLEIHKSQPTILWVDDERDPYATAFRCDDTWVEYTVGITNPGNWNVIWLKNYEQFTNWIELEGLPDVICFDHDLGEQLTGADCMKYLINYLIEKDVLGPIIRCQSSNPSGRHNILSLRYNWWTYWLKRHRYKTNIQSPYKTNIQSPYL